MSRRKYRIAALIASLLIILTLVPAAAFADSGGYTTKAYDVSISTDENHVFHVQETIKVDFYQARHGIYRYIPENSKYYQIKNIDVKGYEFESSSEDRNMIIRIGSADSYVRGEQVYRISYDIVGFKDFSEYSDKLSIDMFPTGWGTEVENATATLTLPKKVDNIEMYEGRYGDSYSGEYFDVESDGKQIKARSRGVLPQGVGLTATADLPEGYWVNPKDKSRSMPVVAGIMGLMALLMMGLWIKVGRDKPVIKTVEFYPPDKMDPLEVAYIANDKVEGKDLAALFMFFASSGYCRIVREGKKVFKMVWEKKIADSEPEYMKKLFRSLFSSARREVYLKDLPEGFGEKAAHVNEMVADTMGADSEAFTAESEKARLLGIGLMCAIPLLAGLNCSYIVGGGIFAVIGTVIFSVIHALIGRKIVRIIDGMAGKKKPVRLILLSIVYLLMLFLYSLILIGQLALLGIVCFFATVICLIATVFVRQRLNNDLYGKVMGFKEFIKTAEHDRLKDLSDENPSYFFDIMPYAYVLGMSTRWADKFADFKIPQPSWYDTGGYGVYDPYFTSSWFTHSSSGIGNSISDFYKGIAGDIAGDIGSSSGGGGSFSGGGFGGGGGGSW